MSGVTVIVPELVPLAGDTLSQLAVFAAVQSIEPPPELLTASVLAAGLAPPAVAPNDRLVGATDSAGGTAGSTVSVTGIVLGEPPAPEAVTVTSVVYGPAAKPVMPGVTVTVPEFVPPAGDTLSQLALSEAVQFSVPPPGLLTASVLAAGLAPPAVAANDRLAGLTERAGACGTPLLKTTVAMSHGVLAPVETRAAGASPRNGRASSTANSISEVG